MLQILLDDMLQLDPEQLHVANRTRRHAATWSDVMR
jgi:hypothetical protein